MSKHSPRFVQVRIHQNSNSYSLFVTVSDDLKCRPFMRLHKLIRLVFIRNFISTVHVNLLPILY